MPRIPSKCPSVNRSVIASEIAEEERQINRPPEREDVISNDEVIECSGGIERCKTVIAMEVLTKHMQVLDGDNSPAMDVGVSCQTWIAERLMSELLPEPMVSCAFDHGGKAPIRPARACSWFDSDTSTNDSTTYGSGGLSPVVQDMEIDIEDLPCEPAMQHKKLSVKLSSPVGTGVAEDFEKLKVQEMEAAPISPPLTPSAETKLREPIRTLGGANLQTSTGADCELALVPFDTQGRECGLMWNFPGIPDSQNVEPCATPNMVQNPKAKHDCEDVRDDPSCLLDSFGAKPFVPDKHAIDLGVAMQFPQQRGPCSVYVGNTMLGDSSMDSSIKVMKFLKVHSMPKKLKIIKNDRFELSPSSEHRSCDPGVKAALTSVKLEELKGPDDSSLNRSKAQGNEELSEIRHQDHRLPFGTGVSVSTSVPQYEDNPCKAANDDNSDHSTLTDKKTSSSTAPQPHFIGLNFTKSVSDLSLINKRIAFKEVISQRQSSDANPEICVYRKNCARQGKSCLAVEAIHQQTGSTSVPGTSFEGKCSTFTAPPPPASTAPFEHVKVEGLQIEKSPGLREVNLTKEQPLVIVAVNVIKPDGPVLPQRRNSYQRIFALQNEQVQVVKRERHLPVDIILSPSACFIVYTAATMKLDWEKNPSLAKSECHAFIANILVNCQIKAMRFSFEKCFMVFEGDSAFTSFILQSTQTLAVAAAAFGMQVQCFVSSGPQCTEDIALLCIERIRKKANRPYPFLMSESENDDELFLEQFPSLNPQAAHAILCLNVPLSNFMLWSRNAMADALQGFEVPKESLELFKIQSVHGKLKEGLARTTSLEESYPDNFPFLSPASSKFGDFEPAFNDGLGVSDHRNFCPLFRDFEIGPLGGGPTFDEHILFSPPFGPGFQLDPKFDGKFTLETCFNDWDNSYQQEDLAVKQLPDANTPNIQQPTMQDISNRSQKPAYVQTSLDEWIAKLEQNSGCAKRESKCELLDMAKPSTPSQTRQLDLFPFLTFSHGRENVQSATVNITPAKRAASALDLFRHKKGTSRPVQKKLKPLSRPHLRSAMVEISSAQAAQAHSSRRFCFKPVTNSSRFSRSF